MELLLTQATAALELVSFGYVAGSFAVYAHDRLNQFDHRKSRSSVTVAKDLLDVSTPSKRKLSPVERLRQQCQEAGIKWRDAHGKNKHLKKAEMMAALQVLERAKRVAVPSPQSTNPTRAPKRVA